LLDAKDKILNAPEKQQDISKLEVDEDFNVDDI